MRVAVLADIHGNRPALRAVLEEIDREQPDAVVVAGDVVAGAYPREVLELLANRREEVVWVRGNAEREAVAAWDGTPVADDEAGRSAAWSARALDRQWRDRLASWPITVAVDGVLCCHGSPREDSEILTRVTPEEIMRAALEAVTEAVVVGGHTHQQFARELDGGPTFVNAGSVGMPYEGRAGAFWLMIEDGRPWPRATGYDIEAAVDELRASGFADVESQLAGSLVDPVDPDWVAAYFEYAAGRGADPGPAPRSHPD